MVRDLGFEQQLLEDLGAIDGLRSRPMFGGLCCFLNGHMLCAARQDRAMYRVRRENDPLVRDIDGISPMTHGGDAKPGFVWLSGQALSDDALRQMLTDMTVEFVRNQPRKEA